MVRINLLPSKKRSVASGAGGSSGLVWKVVAVMLLLLVAEVALLYWLYGSKQDDVRRHSAELQRTQQAIAELQRDVSQHTDIEREMQELVAREEALLTKTSLRVGPQYVLDELKRIVSLPTTRTAIKAARKSGWNVAWESSNVFLTKFSELGDGKVHIVGDARTLDDVAELWLRLRTSELFGQVQLVGITEKKHQALDAPLQHFEFYAQVNLYYQTEQGLALMQELHQPGTDSAPTK